MKKPNSNGQDEIDKAENGINPEVKLPPCGIVMPISALDGCPAEHWQDVKKILFGAAETAGFDPHLVSDAEDVGIIQKRIIQNLYENPIVVCDVSGKNPNVMFELGIRLAFDKPTIIVKDEKTPYSFDTAPIEHLEYPRDLRFNKIVDFKNALAEKITATHQRAATDPSYTTFLKHFGTFSVAKLETKVIPKDAFILEQLRDIQKSVAMLAVRLSELSLKSGPTILKLQESRNPIRRTLSLETADEATVQDIIAQLPSFGTSLVRREKRSGVQYIVMDLGSAEAELEVIEYARYLCSQAHYVRFDTAKAGQPPKP